MMFNSNLKQCFRVCALVAVAAMCSVTSGCAIEPWVKPYERDNLADPIMNVGRHGIGGSYMHHVYQSREASKGAEGGSGGGCGCN